MTCFSKSLNVLSPALLAGVLVVATSATAGPPSSGAILADVNGDKRTDIVVLNEGSSQGKTYGYHLDGFGPPASSSAAIANPGAAWSPAAVCDINKDGISDLLIQTTVASGTKIYAYLLDDAGRPDGPGNTLTTVPQGWAVVGCADVNDDDRADLLINETGKSAAGESNRVFVYLLDGLTKPTIMGTINTNPAGWAVLGFADIDADNKADLLIYTATATGKKIFAYNLSGIEKATIAGTITTVPDAWSISDIGNLTDDGKADIVVSTPSTSPAGTKLYAYILDGTAVLPESGTLTVLPENWDLIGIGEIGGPEEQKGLIVERSTDQRVYAYKVEGTNVTAGNGLLTFPTDWNPVPIYSFRTPAEPLP